MNRRALVVVVAALVLAHLLRLGFLAYALYAILGVGLGSRWLARYWINHVEVTRTHPRAKLRIGESVEITVTVRNSGRLPIVFMIAQDHVSRRLEITGSTSACGTLLPGGLIGITRTEGEA